MRQDTLQNPLQIILNMTQQDAYELMFRLSLGFSGSSYKADLTEQQTLILTALRTLPPEMIKQNEEALRRIKYLLTEYIDIYVEHYADQEIKKGNKLDFLLPYRDVKFNYYDIQRQKEEYKKEEKRQKENSKRKQRQENLRQENSIQKSFLQESPLQETPIQEKDTLLTLFIKRTHREKKYVDDIINVLTYEGYENDYDSGFDCNAIGLYINKFKQFVPLNMLSPAYVQNWDPSKIVDKRNNLTAYMLLVSLGRPILNRKLLMYPNCQQDRYRGMTPIMIYLTKGSNNNHEKDIQKLFSPKFLNNLTYPGWQKDKDTLKQRTPMMWFLSYANTSIKETLVKMQNEPEVSKLFTDILAYPGWQTDRDIDGNTPLMLWLDLYIYEEGINKNIDIPNCLKYPKWEVDANYTDKQTALIKYFSHEFTEYHNNQNKIEQQNWHKLTYPNYQTSIRDADGRTPLLAYISKHRSSDADNPDELLYPGWIDEECYYYSDLYKNNRQKADGFTLWIENIILPRSRYLRNEELLYDQFQWLKEQTGSEERFNTKFRQYQNRLFKKFAIRSGETCAICLQDDVKCCHRPCIEMQAEALIPQGMEVEKRKVRSQQKTEKSDVEKQYHSDGMCLECLFQHLRTFNDKCPICKSDCYEFIKYRSLLKYVLQFE